MSADLQAWQWFLRGRGYEIEADGIDGKQTQEATRHYQAQLGVPQTGKLDKVTRDLAKEFGFDPKQPAYTGAANFPIRPMTQSEKGAYYGEIKWVRAPQDGNREAIKITNGWATNNLTIIKIPSLVGKPLNREGRYTCHKKVAPYFLSFFELVDRAGLSKLILTCDGFYNARTIRGSSTTLSDHAQGGAFDLNAAQNGLGRTPAPQGSLGSLVELYGIAAECELFPGAFFRSRPDGMHFEKGVKK